jgi:BTB/POZ domain-containing protein KCTD9
MAGLSTDELSDILRHTHDTGHERIVDRSWKGRLQRMRPRHVTGPIANAVIISVLVSMIVIAVSIRFDFYTGTWLRDILTEAHGVVADSIFLLVGLAILTSMVEKRQNVERQREAIDDLRGSTDDLAQRRIVGAIRRLNRLGVSDIDLLRCHLAGMDLRGLNFKDSRLAYADLRGAKLVEYEAVTHGVQLTPGYHASVEAVIHVGNVEKGFGRRLPKGTQIAIQIRREPAKFVNADVSHSRFDGLDLRGSNFHGSDAHSTVFDDCDLEDANFSEADLTGASFGNTDLTNVVFTQAKGLTVRQLSAAKSLRAVKGLDPGIARELIDDHPHLFGITRPESSERDMEALFAGDEADLPPITHLDDPHKGRFGGRSEAGGRALRASVTEIPDSPGSYLVDLSVISLNEMPLTDTVHFYLHQTFNRPVVHIQPTESSASLQLRGWGAFTVGVIADSGRTLLELDLAELETAPAAFRAL